MRSKMSVHFLPLFLMPGSHVKGGNECWVRVAQAFTGIFFMGAAIYKLHNYFLIGDQSLAGHFQFWLDNGWPPAWFALLMRWMQPHEQIFEAGTVILQFFPGLLLLLNLWVRPASFLLLLIQIPIFFGTFHHRGFNEFVGLSLWLAAYYMLKPAETLKIGKKTWVTLTLLMILLGFMHQWNRYKMGDAWLSSVPWQRENLLLDIMSISPTWKFFVYEVTAGTLGAYLWTGSFWAEFFLTAALFSRFRLLASAGLLMFSIVRVFTWMNSATSHAVLWVLVLFSWMTHEELLERKVPAKSLFPYLRLLLCFSFDTLRHPFRRLKSLITFVQPLPSRLLCSLRPLSLPSPRGRGKG